MMSALKRVGLTSATGTGINVDREVPAEFARTSPFLQQEIFNSIFSETQMMRYMFSLQLKDLALDKSMISLGSCTMKLNSVSSLAPSSWPEIANMHPFAPNSQTEGYREMLQSLERYLNSITGFAATSLQPTSGAFDEYARLLCIQKYLKSIDENI